MTTTNTTKVTVPDVDGIPVATTKSSVTNIDEPNTLTLSTLLDRYNTEPLIYTYHVDGLGSFEVVKKSKRDIFRIMDRYTSTSKLTNNFDLMCDLIYSCVPFFTDSKKYLHDLNVSTPIEVVGKLLRGAEIEKLSSFIMNECNSISDSLYTVTEGEEIKN